MSYKLFFFVCERQLVWITFYCPMCWKPGSRQFGLQDADEQLIKMYLFVRTE